MEGKSIIVLGDVILDKYCYTESERISTEAPVPISKISHVEYRLGGAANVSANISSLGGKVTLIGLAGFDQQGERLSQQLSRYSIDSEVLFHKNAKTTLKERIFVNGVQLLRIDSETIPNISLYNNFKELLDTYLEEGSLLVLSDYKKGVLTSELISYSIELARQRKCYTVADTKLDNLEVYKNLDLLKINRFEYSKIQDYLIKSKCILIEDPSALCDLWQIGNLIITSGSQGLDLYSSEQVSTHVPAFRPVQVFDVVGAGDTTLAALAVFLSEGKSILEAMNFSAVAAGLAVSKAGTAVISRSEVLQAANGHLSKIMCEEDLVILKRSWKSNHERIVFTNGVYDVMHPGHVSFLTRAKALGTKLILGINTDESVSALKGPSRPIVNQQDRAETVAALSCVDVVILFSSEEQLYELIKLVEPDVLVKGSEYLIKDIVGSDLVMNYGGKIMTLPMIKNYSTTKLIQTCSTLSG